MRLDQRSISRVRSDTRITTTQLGVRILFGMRLRKMMPVFILKLIKETPVQAVTPKVKIDPKFRGITRRFWVLQQDL